MAAGWQECAQSPFGWAEAKGGTHLHTMLTSDFNLLRPFTMLDNTFLATALLVLDEHKANMAMEVVATRPAAATSATGGLDTATLHRLSDSVVIAASTSPFSWDVSRSDFAAGQVSSHSATCDLHSW